jgi:hypothetical protein
MLSDEGLFIKELATYIQYLTFLASLIFYPVNKHLRFYKFFIFYLFNLVFLDVLATYVFTFFEFNIFVSIYYNLIKKKKNLNLVKILAIIFNVIYFISFYIETLKLCTVPLEGVFNSGIIILYFTEFLNSEKILNYKKMLSFWLSVGFLLFYLASVPFFTLLFSNMFNTRAMSPIIYYLTTLLHLCLFYGLIICRKVKK